MIEHLRIGWSAYFFSSNKKLNGKAIEDLFEALRDSVTNAGVCLFRDVRRRQAARTYSAICFPYDRQPSFLAEDAGLSDRIHGFMLVVEHEELVAIHKSSLEIPATFKSEWLRHVGSSNVERAIAKADAKFESMRMRSMSTSKQALRTKTLEADDLENAMPMASASRYVSQRYRVRRGSTRYTATPTTGRIAQSSDRSGYGAAIDWSVEVMAELTRLTGDVAPFIANFARPIDLASLSAATSPVSFAVDGAELADRLFSETPLIKLTKKEKSGKFRELTIQECQDVLQALDREFEIEGPRDALRILDGPSGAVLGILKWGKARIGLSTFSPSEIDRIHVAPADQSTDKDHQTALKMYLDRENLFLVLFDDVSVAYLNGELFEDKAMRDGGASFLRHLIPEKCLKDASSEKGAFRAKQKKFAPKSVFAQIESTIAVGDDVLICDDLGDEWADFIGLNTKGVPPMITFYHAKHGKLSLGASSFHISVSQAEKNLGRLALPQAAMNAKFDGWEAKPYENAKKETEIARLMRGGPRSKIEQHLARFRTSPEVVRRVSIVTSSLSRKAVEDAFASIGDGKRPSAHFVQLYWLLNSFFSACAEVGAVGYVICQP
ncbi:hypothetical protein [Bradyrhizobium australafricanum]|uniref:hypothetical protein n=1 Tax=Bradyrhizobium australafricanum TaxID=2821406 RepID=UPI001CE301E7|nr:hypothetical protein [Bradyrhizobium australafricanum]MCA6100134.1 hypothetical protein [Bradyrhizobium australafricanum]